MGACRSKLVVRDALLLGALRPLEAQIRSMPAVAPAALGEQRMKHVRAARFAGAGPFGQAVAGTAFPTKGHTPFLRVDPRALTVLGGVHVRPGGLPFQPFPRPDREPRRPGVAAPADVRPLRRPARLVAA